MARKRKGSGITPQGNRSTFTNLIGQGTNLSTQRFRILKAILDFETDIANIKQHWIVPALMKMINDRIIHKWNSDQLDNYADLVCYGAQLLAELKGQVIIKEFCPALTRNDASAGAPFTRATWEGLISSLSNIKIPPMSYALVNLFDKVIQLQSAQPEEGSFGQYVAVWKPNKTYTQVETLLGVIESLYDAAVYATQSGQMLVPIDHTWLNTINEVSMISHFGYTVATYFPVNYDNGGAETETEQAFDGTTELYWSDLLGIPEYADAFAAFRGTSGAPHIYVVQSIANDKVSVEYLGAPEDTSLSEYDKASEGMDWMFSMATAASRDQKSPFNVNAMGGMYMVQKANVLPSAPAWDRRMANWLVKHSRDPGVPEAGLSVLPDIITTMKRVNTPKAGPSDPYGGRGQRGASEHAAAKDAGYSNMIDAQAAGKYQKGGKRYDVPGY